MEDHCGKAGRSKVNRLLAKQTRLFSYIEGLQAETRVYYTLWQCGPELRILVSGEAGPAVRCTFPADMECRARNLLQYPLHEKGAGGAVQGAKPGGVCAGDAQHV